MVGTLRQSLVASILHWIPLATLSVLVSGMVYVAVQQSYRTSADDPQVQMAVDARNALMSGTSPQSLVPASQLDISQSLAPYLVIYDANGQVVAASATLHGLALVPPAGVFQSARRLSVDTITWTTEPGVRSAIAVVSYPGGYVLAGRSLKLVEQRENSLVSEVAAACAAMLVLTYLAVFATQALAARLPTSRAQVR